MSSAPAGRREVNVRVATEIVFIELWLSLLMAKPTMHPVFRAMCNKMIAEYPKVFEAYQFSSKTIKEHLKKVRRTERGQKRWTFLVVRLYFSVR